MLLTSLYLPELVMESPEFTGALIGGGIVIAALSVLIAYLTSRKQKDKDRENDTP